MKPGSMTARLLAVCCAEPMTLATLAWRVDPTATFDQTSWGNALRELKKRGMVTRAAIPSPSRAGYWQITPYGEEILDKLWAQERGVAS